MNKLSEKMLASLGIAALNNMQEVAFEAIQDESEVLLLAPTGSGKTLAFLLPLANMLKPEAKGIQALIITPSRELALQIEQVWKKMGTGFKVNTCYGGHDINVEMQSLSEPPALLIGTPGRISDHILRKSIDLRQVAFLVLDEFDKSLSLGFEEEMSFVIEKLTGLSKRVLVSATSQIRIPDFARFDNPKRLDFTKGEEIEGLALRTVFFDNKIETLFQLLCHFGQEPALIFCNFRESAEQTCRDLQERGIEAAFFHGKMEQLEREKALVNFRNGSTIFLVASDLAARGLDIPAVKHVVHYEMPFTKADFIHRNGRTARMNAEGAAYLLLQEGEPRKPYIEELPQVFEVPVARALPQRSEWVTLYISGGKKDKLSKVDIVGFLSKKGNLEKQDIGLIELMDYMSFVAVRREKSGQVLRLIKNEKMKGQKYKIELAR